MTAPTRAVTIAETAERLGLCRASIYNMVTRGEIRIIKFGRATRIPESELTRLIDGGAA